MAENNLSHDENVLFRFFHYKLKILGDLLQIRVPENVEASRDLVIQNSLKQITEQIHKLTPC